MNNIKIFVAGNSIYGTWLSDNIVYSIEEADLIVLTGGADVNPALYDEKLHKTTHHSVDRDLMEIRAFEQAVKHSKPVLGICKGSQMLTVLNGGKLIQNVNNHGLFDTHKIEMDYGKILRITSTHHQMMFPFNLSKKDYQILATSYPKRSDHYQTGFGEYLDKDVPVEPEIVFYPKTRSLAIQGHPEYMDEDSEAVIECKQLIKDLLLCD